MEDKRCIKRCILFNSAGFPYAEVCQDGHIDIAGGSGTGKSTLLNAFLFPFLIDNNLLNIGSEKDEFAKYYFENSNSFIFYEIRNKKGADYCAVLHKTRQDALIFHVINASFSEDWLYNDADGNVPVNSWDELVRNVGPALGSGSYNREAFNRVLLGVDTDYSESLSLMSFDGKKIDGAKATYGIRSLLSTILRNRELSQATLKETLVSAVIAENQSKTDGIMLATHRKNLGDFISRKHDIELATVRNKEGVTVLESVSKDIFDRVDDYGLTVGSIKSIPGLLAYAMDAARKKESRLKESLRDLDDSYTRAEAEFESRIGGVTAEIENKIAERAVAQNKVDSLKEVENRYKDCYNVEDLVRNSSRRKELNDERKEYSTALSELNKDADEIRARESNEIARIRNVYQDRINKSNNDAVKEKDKIAQKNNDAQAAYNEECRGIRENYKSQIDLAGNDVSDALELVLRAVRETESELTLEEVRTRLDGKELLSMDIREILSDVSSHHNPSGHSGAELSDIERKCLDDYSAKRNKVDILNRQMNEELDAAARKKDRVLSDLKVALSAVETTRRQNYQTLLSECREKETEIHQTYASLLSGNDAIISTEVAELKTKLDSVEFVLEQLDTYPSVADDYRNWLSKSGELKDNLGKLNMELANLRKEMSDIKSEKNLRLKSIDAERISVRADFAKAQQEVKSGNQFITTHLIVREAIEGGASAATDKVVSDLISDYYRLDGRLNVHGQEIPRLVRRLFEPGMLSPVDTFSLGCGSTSSLEECLSIADNLRALLQTTSGGETLLDSHVKTNASIWIHELQSISGEMATIESNMSLLLEDCRKANRFMDANNATDCCADIRLDIEENSSMDLLLMLREINEFWHTKGHLIGYDNLFSGTEGNSANTEAMNLLKGFSEALSADARNEIPLSEMFDVKMSFREKGNYHRNLLKFDNPASGSTNVMLKSIINIALLKILVDANRSNRNVALPIPVDEMNDISVFNLKAFVSFADAAGMNLIFCGQHHTIPMSFIRYSYNTWDELIPQEDGDTVQIKWISLEGSSNLTGDGDGE